MGVISWARRLAEIGAALAAFMLAGATAAETPPEPGAVALPDDFAISLPFPEGVEIRVSCGYGPACSSYHVNTDTDCCTNDFHALDLVRNQADNGRGEPVTAIAAGTVRYADWATGGFSSFGRLVIVEHDYDADGHSYFSIYAHLASISVDVGAHVGAKEEIGLLGGSSNMLDDQFGYHVHIAVYRDALVDSGAAHGGHAVVPEPIDGYEDLVDGMVMIAGAAPEPGTGGSGTDTGGNTTIATSWGDEGGTTIGGSWSGGSGSGSATDADPGATASDAEASGATVGDALPPAGGRAGGDAGCGCRSSSRSGGALALWLIAVAYRRRSRRTRGSCGTTLDGAVGFPTPVR